MQNKYPVVKTYINQLQKQVEDELRVETQARWEKCCNSISLENDPSESCRKIKNFLKPKGQRACPTLRYDDSRQDRRRQSGTCLPNLLKGTWA